MSKRAYIVSMDAPQWDAKKGDTVELELDADGEAVFVQSGRLELVPVTYEVTAGTEVFDTPPGERFIAALPIGQELALVDGGALKVVQEQPKKTKGGKA